jgi:hypothetical protein
MLASTHIASAGGSTADVQNATSSSGYQLRSGEEHELAFLSGGGDVLYTDGEPDEALLAAAGTFEVEAFGPGSSRNATDELAAGECTLFCIVRPMTVRRTTTKA